MMLKQKDCCNQDKKIKNKPHNEKYSTVDLKMR